MIKASIQDVPQGMPPSQTPVFVRKVADLSHQIYTANGNADRARAIPEQPLRASWISKRCDRQLWYAIKGIEESNPPDASAMWRMRMGTAAHELIANTVEQLPGGFHDDPETGGRVPYEGWHSEVPVDLSPAGFPGSTHADHIFYEDGQPKIVVEVKSASGFPFKLATSGNVPEGPKWDHIMQAAMVAVAVEAPMFLVCWWALEPNNKAANMHDKFTAEWQFETADWADAVAAEAARQRRVLGLANDDVMPERALNKGLQAGDKRPVPAGAVVTDPAKGMWVTYSPADGLVNRSGTVWTCGYCNHRDRCVADGEQEAQ